MAGTLSDRGERWIDDLLGRLTPAQKLAQLVLVVPGVADGRPDAATRAALELGIGALHSVPAMPVSAAARYHDEVRQICAAAGLPSALLAGNLESGLAYALGSGGTDFPYPRGIGLTGDAELAYRVAAAGALEARAAGFHWTFSPCVDVITVPDDPILGIRAYGVPAEQTAALGAAQIRGYQDHGMLATAKHFPGHGDSSVDSHLDLPRVARTVEQHEEIHLAPFRAAVEAGVASIMVAHLELPALGIDVPATFSRTVNRVWLREELGFEGVIITDSLGMAAVSGQYDAAEGAVLALRAGADVANAKCAAAEAPRIVAHLLAALAEGRLDEEQIDASVRRLLRARVAIGLDQPQPLDFDRAAALDEGLVWEDPSRSATVSLFTREPVVVGPKQVVVGDSALARRFSEVGVRRGLPLTLEPEALVPGALAKVGARNPGALLIPVVDPGPVPLARQLEVVRDAVGDPHAVVVINSGEPAQAFGECAGRVLTAAAVDAFGIVTDAAIDAAFDVLTDEE
ncbi:glycoside hydrolase family 3 N-terminal domain-containing protein [Kribbella sp. NPDC051770]|uniref:glycoside hydrolase family 3 protein n=1 Tax=Kribbella sp. NPDC051770 TaxID=3155413 RepID=UPI0034416BE6